MLRVKSNRNRTEWRVSKADFINVWLKSVVGGSPPGPGSRTGKSDANYCKRDNTGKNDLHQEYSVLMKFELTW